MFTDRCNPIHLRPPIPVWQNDFPQDRSQKATCITQVPTIWSRRREKL